MARPRKYSSEAEEKAAKLEKQRQRRAAKHALKNDPTKRKDAAVNAEAYPFAPINDETMAVIRQIMSEARQVHDATKSTPLAQGRRAAARLIEWENAHKARLPFLEEETVDCGQTEKGVRITYKHGEGYEWNRLYNFLRVLAHFMERSGRNKLKADRHAERERTEADEAGLTVAELRTGKEVTAKRKWQERTQAAYHRAKGEKALAKRNARIERDSTERMKERETFGRF